MSGSFQRISPMSPGRLLFVLFLLVPIVEIYLLIKVGSLIGALPTVALVVLTAVIGSAMLRHQGIAVLREAQNTLDSGGLPARALLDGVFLVVGGVLLLTPGFFTDALGFLCLLPAGRNWLIRAAVRYGERLRAEGRIRVERGGEAAQGPVTLDGEFRREDD
jgi:UPF0716 protein FxsA